MEKRASGMLLYKDKALIFESLADAQAGVFIKGLLQYAFYDTSPDFSDPTLCAIWGMFKACIDRDREEYRKKCESNSKAGKASAAKRKANANASEHLSTDVDECAHSQPTLTETETVPITVSKTESKTENSVCEASEDNRASPKPRRFIPPTVEEVQAYCIERGNHVDAQRFVDYYAGSGWKRGNAQITDWKAVLRTWEDDDANRAAAQHLRQNARSREEMEKEHAQYAHESGFGYTWD